MPQLILLYALTILTTHLHAQVSRFGPGAHASTSLSFLTAAQENFDSGNRPGVTVGINVYYDLTSRLHLVSGLGWEIVGITGRDYSPVYGCDIDPGMGVDPFNSYFEYQDNVHYLVLPAEVRYMLSGNHERGFFLQGGVTGHFKLRVSGNSLIIECDMPREVGNSFNTFYGMHVRGTFGPGYRAHLGKVTGFAQPYIQYSLNSVLKQLTRPHLLNLALRVGVEF